jgi:hypothetical protein
MAFRQPIQQKLRGSAGRGLDFDKPGHHTLVYNALITTTGYERYATMTNQPIFTMFVGKAK